MVEFEDIKHDYRLLEHEKETIEALEKFQSFLEWVASQPNWINGANPDGFQRRYNAIITKAEDLCQKRENA